MGVVHGFQLHEWAPAPDCGEVKGQAAFGQGTEQQQRHGHADEQASELERQVSNRVRDEGPHPEEVDLCRGRIDRGHVRPVNGRAHRTSRRVAEGRDGFRPEQVLGAHGPAPVAGGTGGEQPVRPQIGEGFIDGHVRVGGDARLLGNPVPGVPGGIVAGPRRSADGNQAQQHSARDDDGTHAACGDAPEGTDSPKEDTPGQEGTDNGCRFEGVVGDDHPPQQARQDHYQRRQRGGQPEDGALRAVGRRRRFSDGHTAVLSGPVQGESRQKTRPCSR